jgi:hypothetical protein
MPVRRYDINVIVNQQTNPPAPTPAPSPNAPAPPGSPASLDGLAKYLTSVYAIRQAWGLANQALKEAVDLQEQLQKNQSGAANKAADFQRNMREYLRNEGVFTNPSKRAGVMQRAEEFGAKVGFPGQNDAINFLGMWSSDVSQYAGKLYSAEDDKKVSEWIARSSVISGVDPVSATKMGSAIVGSTNWRKQHGDKAAENAYAQYEKVTEILSKGKGNRQLNYKNFARFANEMITVDREEGRITGEDALVEAAVLMREVAEYNPEEAEVFGRNSIEFIRQLGKPSVAKHLKAAGISYGKPVEGFRKLVQYRAALKDKGKIPEGETLIDFMRNQMKGNIRGAAGGYAIVNSEAKGLGDQARKDSKDIDADNVVGKLEAMEAGDKALALDKATQAIASGQRGLGTGTIPLETTKQQAISLFLAKGYGHGMYDTRGLIEKGWMSKLNPQNWFGSDWTDYDASGGPNGQAKSDYASMMLIKELAKRNYPGQTRRRVDASGSEYEMPMSEFIGDNFYRSDSNTRDVLLQREISKYESGGKSVQALLQELIDTVKKPGGPTPVVPLTPVQPGMVNPGQP